MPAQRTLGGFLRFWIAMSYSISVVAATIAAAREALVAKFDETVVKPQPVHAKDRDQALNAADMFLALLGPQPADHEVTITMNGSLSWDGAPEEGRFRWANFGFSGGYIYKKPEA